MHGRERGHEYESSRQSSTLPDMPSPRAAKSRAEVACRESGIKPNLALWRVAYNMNNNSRNQGVDTANSLAMGTSMGCDLARFVIAPPADGSAILDWVRSNGWN